MTWQLGLQQLTNRRNIGVSMGGNSSQNFRRKKKYCEKYGTYPVLTRIPLSATANALSAPVSVSNEENRHEPDLRSI
jgi:hypothetical protein